MNYIIGYFHDSEPAETIARGDSDFTVVAASDALQVPALAPEAYSPARAWMDIA